MLLEVGHTEKHTALLRVAAKHKASLRVAVKSPLDGPEDAPATEEEVKALDDWGPVSDGFDAVSGSSEITQNCRNLVTKYMGSCVPDA